MNKIKKFVHLIHYFILTINLAIDFIEKFDQWK